MEIKRAQKVFLLDNGMIVTFDVKGTQISELQGAYSIDLHKRILLEACQGCTLNGFEILPSGFLQHVNAWFNYWKFKNLSWNEINEL